MQTPNRIGDCLRDWNQPMLQRTGMCFFSSSVAVLFICLLYRFVDCIGRAKKESCSNDFVFFFRLPFRNKLKYPSVGASINFKSESILYYRKIPTKTNIQAIY